MSIKIRPNSKQSQLAELLQRPVGATITQMMQATGWQSHTIRGAMSGILKKKWGLIVTSEKNVEGKRIYKMKPDRKC